MEISGWLIFILLVQVIHGIGTWKLYVKAGRKAWEAFIPVYNGIVLMQIINRPKWWILLLFIPVINLFLFPIIWIETLRTFGKKSTIDMVLGVVTLGFYIAYVNYTQEVTYRANRDLTAPNKTMDTLGSLSFAIVVATLVHTYFIQPYTIPTSSLEKSLLVGDFLFVSKFHYGARTPMTPIAAPMVHDTLPIVKVKSYSAKPSLPYFRFPALQKIERNDIVVFNWPADTLFHMYKAADKRYDKPIDKKTNYVKRCTAIPGDKIEIKEGIVFINGKESILPERAKPQYSYKVAWDGKTPVDLDYIKKELNITDAFGQIANDTLIFSALPQSSVDRLKNIPGLTKVERIIHKETDKTIFPGTKDWNVDNLGPIYIPEAGKTVELNKETIPFYKKVIGEYEGNDLKINGDEIRINGQIATSYTFKQDYYWMMGDNRHNSLDSRYWGFVPADHIVGKPIFIWMSIDGINDGLKNWSIRWDRLFTTVSGDGQPKSYFQYFLIALAAYFAFDYFRKKKKKKEEA
ncbi:signal peptidase I [Flavobacterium sp.]|uniref:signal peptidase I n=1 Tax=Flavobacterium sp. TaxID=239 RepID=UPI0008AA7BDC|nr:signal peptidase I [Flavobacterium sp.]OGS61691.1 MAG: S26 family signal peptidase [Flavobacteria bacterium GWF1_32_7]HBD26519.1 signal peptidase I [Flavobacterium sp.]